MEIIKSDRGFEFLRHVKYGNEMHGPNKEITRLVSQSSAVGDYEDSMDKPGSSYLWIGEDHHLDRSEVKQLIGCLQHWLATGSLNQGD